MFDIYQSWSMTYLFLFSLCCWFNWASAWSRCGFDIFFFNLQIINQQDDKTKQKFKQSTRRLDFSRCVLITVVTFDLNQSDQKLQTITITFSRLILVYTVGRQKKDKKLHIIRHWSLIMVTVLFVMTATIWPVNNKPLISAHVFFRVTKIRSGCFNCYSQFSTKHT